MVSISLLGVLKALENTLDALYNYTHYLILGKKYLLIPTFSTDSHFSPYILFLLLLVLILKNVSRFGPYRYIRNGES